jgi:hypothetical protein
MMVELWAVMMVETSAGSWAEHLAVPTVEKSAEYLAAVMVER